MKLKDLLRGIPVLSATADPDLDIGGVSYDSRATKPGDLFVAMKGFAVDGHTFIGKAAAAGAAAVLCQDVPGGMEIPYVQVADSRRALAEVGANYFGHPADDMTMVAVTGTNGKTTTTYLLKAILEQAAGAKVGLIGTNQNMIGREVIPTERTTPESFEVQKLFARMRDAGCTHVVMEVSSHALVLDRVYGVRYAVGIFTNLTQDHLDFHKTMEAYCDAKAILFRNCDVGVVNADDPWTERLLREATCRVFTYAEHAEADLQAKNVSLGADHIAFDAVEKSGSVPVQVGIPGDLWYIIRWMCWERHRRWGSLWRRVPGCWPQFPTSRAGWRWSQPPARTIRSSSTTPTAPTDWRTCSPASRALPRDAPLRSLAAAATGIRPSAPRWARSPRTSRTSWW